MVIDVVQVTQCLQPDGAELAALYTSFATSAGLPVSNIRIIAPDACPRLDSKRQTPGNYDYLCKVDDVRRDCRQYHSLITLIAHWR